MNAASFAPWLADEANLKLSRNRNKHVQFGTYNMGILYPSLNSVPFSCRGLFVVSNCMCLVFGVAQVRRPERK